MRLTSSHPRAVPIWTGLAAVLLWFGGVANAAAQADPPTPQTAPTTSAIPSNFSFAIETGVRYEKNIALSGDRVASGEAIFGDNNGDTTAGIAAVVDYAAIAEPGRELVFTARPFYEKVDEFDDLSNFGISVSAAYRGEFGSAFTAPWYALSVGYTAIQFTDSDIRDGGWLDAELAVGARFSPRFGLSGGIRYFDRNQSDTSDLCPAMADGRCPGEDAGDFADWNADSVFENSKWGLFAHADWFITSRTQVFVEYSFWDGEEATSSSFNGLGGTNPLLGSDTFAEDPAFGNFNAGGTPQPVLVWRLDARQHVFEVGIRQTITDKLSVDLTGIRLLTGDAESVDRVMPNVDEYRNTAVELGLRYRVN